MKTIDKNKLEDLIMHGFGLDATLEQQLDAIRKLARVRYNKAYAFIDELINVEVIKSLPFHEYDEIAANVDDGDFRIPYPFERTYISFHAYGILYDIIRQEFETKETTQRRDGIDYLRSWYEPLTDRARVINDIIIGAKETSKQVREIKDNNHILDEMDVIDVEKDTTKLMQRTAINSLGRFQYTATELEDFIDYLAEELGVILPYLDPICRSRFTHSLRKEGKSDYQITINYERDPSQTVVDKIKSLPESKDNWHYVAPILYADSQTSQESVSIRRGNKNVSILFSVTGEKVVQVFVEELPSQSMSDLLMQHSGWIFKRLGEKSGYIVYDFSGTRLKQSDLTKVPLSTPEIFHFVEMYLAD